MGAAVDDVEAWFGDLARRGLSASTAARRLDYFDAQVARLKASLASLNPAAVLERGYSLTRDAQGAVVRDAAKLQAGERLTTTLAKGWVESEVRTKGG